MATIEHMTTVTDMLSKLEYSTRICSSRTPEFSVDVAMKIQEDFKDGRTSQIEYDEEMVHVNEIISVFQSKCSCHERSHTDLVLPLKEYPKY